ncbi:MAG: hypothetical protein IJL26_08925 [Clostridia bacterium]|nr:hypothetical protein [Clostridia bacterium]
MKTRGNYGVGAREKRKKRILYLSIPLAVLFGITAIFAGMRLRIAMFGGAVSATVSVACSLVALLPVVFFIVTLIRLRKTEEKLRAMNVKEQNDFMLSHRKDAEKTAEEKFRLLNRLRRGADLTAVLTFLFGMFAALTAGCCYEKYSVIPCALSLYSVLMQSAALQRVRILPSGADQRARLDETEYPELFRLIREAREKTDSTGEVSLYVTADCGASIAKSGRGYELYLGALLLAVLDARELAAILPHEFAHMKNAYLREGKNERYLDWLETPDAESFFSVLQILFSYFDIRFRLEYAFFLYSVSLLSERAADALMKQEGCARDAAAALLKIGYYDYYSWMLNDNGGSAYADEARIERFLRAEATDFRRESKTHCEEWNRLIEKTLPANTDTHPVLRERLAGLGFNAPFLPSYECGDGEYERECDRALMTAERICLENVDVSALREAKYLEPLKTVEDWESEGCPLVAERYADVLDALDQLCRFGDAETLCRRAIGELPPPAAAYAYYMLAGLLLHSFDPAGLEYMYRAMELNNNAVKNGLDEIGAFCCMMGLPEELEKYRRKSVELLQRDEDLYGRLKALKKGDELSVEHLPEELRRSLIEWLQAEDGGRLASVSVVRKTVTPDFFGSAVIVRFREGTGEEAREELMHRVFSYLDTCSDWQFCLFEYDDVVHVNKKLIDDAVIYPA